MEANPVAPVKSFSLNHQHIECEGANKPVNWCKMSRVIIEQSEIQSLRILLSPTSLIGFLLNYPSIEW